MGDPKLQSITSLLRRHWRAFSYAVSVLGGAILRTGRRPVIFSRWSGMGDIICTVPAAVELKKRHPGASFIYNCDPDFALIPRVTGVTEHCTHFRDIGLVGHWYRFLLGGFYHFAHHDDSPQTGARRPMFQEFCEQFGVPPAPSHPALSVNAEALSRVKARLEAAGLAGENLILFHCGPTWPVKEWPAAHWATLAANLRQEGFTNLVQIGLGSYLSSQQNQPLSENTSVHLAPARVPAIPQTTSLVGEFSLEESFAAISLARLFVGVDSGLLHVAACLRIPCVGIFGPTLQQMFYTAENRPFFAQSTVDCAGCHHHIPRLHWITGCPYDMKCMSSISPPTVVENSLNCLGSLDPQKGSGSRV